MRAFVTEESCLKCHAAQGYKTGDIRGGLCVTLSVQPLINATRKQIAGDLVTHGMIWILGLSMTGLATRKMLRSAQNQKQAEEALTLSLSLLNATLESTADGILVTNKNGRISRWNQKFIDLWHIPEELLNTNILYPVTNHIKAQMTRPEDFFDKVMELYNNPEESSFDTLSLSDGRFFRRFSQPQRIGSAVVGRVWSFSDITNQKKAEVALEESNRKLEVLSTTDSLTGIANRRCFDETLTQEYARQARSGTELSLIMLDIDHFKLFNDYYGHVAGDECLRQIGRVMADCAARVADLPARYGGEEFICILPETDSDGAVGIAEKIRMSIQNLCIPHKESPVAKVITASLGVVTVTCSIGGSVVDIISQADAQLYRAKSDGRNRVAYQQSTRE
jgi:diguanylate cyclase (GGDEF)-like protein